MSTMFEERIAMIIDHRIVSKPIRPGMIDIARLDVSDHNIRHKNRRFGYSRLSLLSHRHFGCFAKPSTRIVDV